MRPTFVQLVTSQGPDKNFTRHISALLIAAVHGGFLGVVPTCSSPCARLRSGFTSERVLLAPSPVLALLDASADAALSQGSTSSSIKASRLTVSDTHHSHTARPEQETVNTRGSILGRESQSVVAELLRWPGES